MDDLLWFYVFNVFMVLILSFQFDWFYFILLTLLSWLEHYTLDKIAESGHFIHILDLYFVFSSPSETRCQCKLLRLRHSLLFSVVECYLERMLIFLSNIFFTKHSLSNIEMLICIMFFILLIRCFISIDFLALSQPPVLAIHSTSKTAIFKLSIFFLKKPLCYLI